MTHEDFLYEYYENEFAEASMDYQFKLKRAKEMMVTESVSHDELTTFIQESFKVYQEASEGIFGKMLDALKKAVDKVVEKINDAFSNKNVDKSATVATNVDLKQLQSDIDKVTQASSHPDKIKNKTSFKEIFKRAAIVAGSATAFFITSLNVKVAAQKIREGKENDNLMRNYSYLSSNEKKFIDAKDKDKFEYPYTAYKDAVRKMTNECEVQLKNFKSKLKESTNAEDIKFYKDMISYTNHILTTIRKITLKQVPLSRGNDKTKKSLDATHAELKAISKNIENAAAKANRSDETERIKRGIKSFNDFQDTYTK